jgi:thiosulfate dehydrogenase [quinone] large subunit
MARHLPASGQQTNCFRRPAKLQRRLGGNELRPVVEIEHMPTSALERALVVYFRLTMGWTFLYASSHQIFDPAFTVVGFLSHTKTFHDLFAVFTTPTMAPITTVLVEYGHLLIGLSLLFGLMVRVSASAGVFLMLTYWLAHMDWPFIENKNNFIIDYHLVYAGVLVLLIVKRAGHVWGLDGLVEKLTFFQQHPKLRAAVA